MKRNRIRQIIILGSVSLIGLIIFQVYWVFNTFGQLEKQFNQSIKSALFNVAVNIAEFNNSQVPNRNPVQQVGYNYYVVDLNDTLAPMILEHFLQTEFAHSNIDIDYEYAIYDCFSDAMVYGSYSLEKGFENNNAGISKFKRFEEYPYYFGIIFPGKSFFIFSSTRVWLVTGFVLITAIAFFAFAVVELIRQKKLSDIQKDFINNMTHEFKTPLSTIGISAGVLSDPEISNHPDRLSKYAKIILNQNRNLEEKIEKILQSSLSEKARLKLDIKEIELNSLITETISGYKVKIDEHHAEVKTFLDENIPKIKGDEFHLANIIFNLLDNACKYSEDNPEIIIKTENQKHEIVMIIQDHGVGIEPKYWKKIFDKFYRIPTGNVHNVKGFGLGLSYVSNVVKAHGWKIILDSETGKGSSFNIKIPA